MWYLAWKSNGVNTVILPYSAPKKNGVIKVLRALVFFKIKSKFKVFGVNRTNVRCLESIVPQSNINFHSITRSISRQLLRNHIVKYAKEKQASSVYKKNGDALKKAKLMIRRKGKSRFRRGKSKEIVRKCSRGHRKIHL